MNRLNQYEEHKEYIEINQLDKLINFKENMDYKEDTFDSVDGKLNIPFPPEANDLVRLHKLIRSKRFFTILEFGTGYSTIIMADALAKNQKEWESLPDRPKIRNNFMFKLFCIDASSKWIKLMEDKIPENLKKIVNFQQSDVEIGKFNGQLCHYYSSLQDIVPDFIYLDGPSAKDVKGEINGLSFNCEERTVMSGDLLLMESTFIPGTFILVDGRTNNARFLERNFSRDYKIKWDKKDDITTFELFEDRLGKFNLLGKDFY
ncbi:hypothetical protein N9C88_03660 [Candidatus Pseudothioglobus singularis]|nr:hypothetical protein [Candidatus Pseudothioglobus singularis]